MTHAGALHAWVTAFVDELARSGVRHVCVSPGSRSTPLAIAFAEESRIRHWMHYDERSSAFFALGIARFTREPVALLCTSGTAAANFHPAIVEARYARVPLIVLTADRPHELRENGAPQTIDQIGMFGRHVLWAVDLPLPEASAVSLRYLRTTAVRAVAMSSGAPAGPVHLNFPFREPLIPARDGVIPAGDNVALLGRADWRPYARVTQGARQPESADLAELRDAFDANERGLLMCGPHDDPCFPEAVVAFAATVGYPILADPLSGVRVGTHDRRWVVDSYDALLRDDAFVGTHEPGVVLQFGATSTSKPLQQYLQRHPAARQIVVDGGGGWNEPLSMAGHHVFADEATLCRALARSIVSRPTQSTWARGWLAAAVAARRAIATAVDEIDEPFEGRVFCELTTLLPEGALLVVGNSMPVRDLDTFLPSGPGPLRIIANRGANGIDGVVSTALGASAASDGPTVLVIGDLSFYHDLNGLLAAKLHGLNLTVILINNDGGGIFSFLPQADDPRHFEELFGTPHGLDFQGVVEMYGGAIHRPGDWTMFRQDVASSLLRQGLNVIEVRTDRARNVELHRRMWPAITAAIRAS